jgi:adenylate kinase
VRLMLLMGPPGVGKGTVSDRLAERLGARHISTGNLLREAIAQGTELGRHAEGCIARGELVPDGLIGTLLEEQLDGLGERPCLLDGFPRTLAQARLLEEGLLRKGERVDAVIELEAPEAVLLKRLGGRLICEVCGAGFHSGFIPPKRAGECDRCGGGLIQRADDRDEAIRRRLDVYARQMAELRPFYRDRGVLIPVDASGSPAETEAGVLKALVPG